MSNVALIVAGGSSTRFGGDVPKQFREIAGRPMLSWTISRFQAAPVIDSIVVVAPEQYMLEVGDHIVDPFGFSKVTKIVTGGESRGRSVLNGLRALPTDTRLVGIHDAARPLISVEDIGSVFDTAAETGAAMIATAATDTVKRVENNYIVATLDRSKLFLAQTPQVFRFPVIREAYEQAEETGLERFTDDASLLEGSNIEVKIVPSTSLNIKVTTPDDMRTVEAFLKEQNG